MSRDPVALAERACDGHIASGARLIRMLEEGDTGAVDGLFGPATRAALARAEAALGLIADGHPDARTLAALGLNLSPQP